MATRTPITIDEQVDGDRDVTPIESGGNKKSAGDIPKIAGFDVHSPGEFLDAGTDDTGSSYTGEPKRRGRPRGSKNRSAEAKSPHNLADGLEKLLLSVHAMGSVFLHCPELELDPVEARLIASSVRDLSKFYNVTMDPKKLAMVEFSTVLASVYGLRGVAIYKRLRDEKKKGPQKVTPIRTEPVKAVAASAPLPTAPPAEKRMPVPSDIWGASNGVEDLSQL